MPKRTWLYYSTQLNSTQHFFITQTGIGTAIDLKSHFKEKKRQSKDNNKNHLKSKMDNIILALSH
jgi:hypothetical protein